MDGPDGARHTLVGETVVVRYGAGASARERRRARTAALWLPLLGAPGAAMAGLLHAAATYRWRLAAGATVALIGWVSVAAAGQLEAQRVPVQPVVAAGTAGGGGSAMVRVPVNDTSLVALLVGRSGRIGGGAWAGQAGAARVRLEDLPAPAAGAGAAASATARRLLLPDYGTVDVLGAQYVEAALLGPEESGTSEAAGVTAPSETAIERRTAWAVTLRADDPPPPDATTARGIGDSLMELVLVDAQTGVVLARPPAMPLGEVDAFLRRIGRAPVYDPHRPLNFFGDPFP